MSEEIKKLIDGNKKFRKKFFSGDRALFDMLVEQGQRPKTMIISCSDSRVDPAIVFNCQPGDLFVIRSMANLVPPCESSDTYHGTSATLEFGTCFLEVQQIIIFGHARCGGIQALMQQGNRVLESKRHSFIAKWMEIALPAYNKVMAEYGTLPLQEQVVLCEQYALINSLNNLYTFPWIQERIAKGTLSLHAWYLDLATGIVHIYDQEKGRWAFYE